MRKTLLRLASEIWIHLYWRREALEILYYSDGEICIEVALHFAMALPRLRLKPPNPNFIHIRSLSSMPVFFTTNKYLV
jgi:hypothetical protein